MPIDGLNMYHRQFLLALLQDWRAEHGPKEDDKGDRSGGICTELIDLLEGQDA